jgi:hypothetical protein
MISDLMKGVNRFVDLFKKPLYGRTFRCPVCHLELSAYDTDTNGCLVCPLCGVVVELYETYGHFVPVVNDVEINRVQPKMRLHPLATHLPIGLFPFALLGAFFLLTISLVLKITGIAPDGCIFCLRYAPIIDQSILFLLAVSVAAATMTFWTGYRDWKRRYGGRSYRIIALKIRLSFLYWITGLATVLLHPLVFDAGVIGFAGMVDYLVAVLYFITMGLSLFTLATLGHVGGYLVFGR